MRREILRRLRRLEQEQQVQILLAVESGSRAWGFASPDSDYDVRFVYVRPRSWYLSFDVERQRDVIELPIVDEIDCNGWDLKKALQLCAKSNGALLEWLNSPIRYLGSEQFCHEWRQVAYEYFNNVALCHHYSRMAKGNAQKYLLGKPEVKLKKYFYVLRPLLAVRHIEAGLGVPPIEFGQLVELHAPTELRQEIAQLLQLKCHAPEVKKILPCGVLNHFIEAELNRHRDAFRNLPSQQHPNEFRDVLNRLFQRIVAEDIALAV